MARGEWGGIGGRNPFKVRITWTDEVHVQQTGFHLRSAGVNVSSPAEVAAEVLDWVDEHFRTILGTNQRVLGIDVVDLVTLEGAGESPAAMNGTVSVATVSGVPAALACVIGMKGELRTRYGQGRMFWPVVVESQIDGDLVNNTFKTAAESIIAEMTSLWIGNDVSGHNLINVHGVIPPKAATPSRPARPEIPPMWYDVTTIRLNPAITFLRSRKAGVGS